MKTRPSFHNDNLTLFPMCSDALQLLRCPENRSPLVTADDDTMRRINAAIDDRRIVNKVGKPIDDRIEAGLIREDGTLLYPVVDGIPVLLPDDAIPLDQLVD